ncbi:MAG: LuxR C-terminal-related transcriptional regulator [Actinomycetota bacterium]|nr:LuxR C-terminal-related transcriptional regulator [Actinomycetota bacterium]
MRRKLTPAQLEILWWSSLGFQDKEIAARTGRSTATVRTLAAAAMVRVGAHTRAGAIYRAVRLGELRLP